ncbi:SgrR family transcriptional regulator [Enterobacter roggenkampii]|uniref:SgrR family transcriptional regulator n=1 Tax=Enterobacter roggenkampii TaxID=1812935 RepID=UPI0008DE119D|nr:SgrR family transcriptional regulator [Enterobacter roggenkampii]OHY45147.1 peptide ABC transporter substrate-binding protein [Enterobacter roggenkampii]OHY63620.1 peptide ABC transporter substrate-binding protein [Enterobacter roggenkampii]
MNGLRREHQYLRLLTLFPSREVTTTIQALAEGMCCSKRHMRALLVQMQAAGWLEWQSSPGRGHKTRLRLLCNEHQLLMTKADRLLDAGDYGAAIDLLGDEKHLIAQLLRTKMGYSIRDDYQLLRIPYYRTMPNLYPGTPLRRSEIHLVRQIFNGLTRINEETGMVESDLAHHWRMIDTLHWRFFLRPGVHFHDGRLLTSKDVVVSLRRCALLPLFSHIKRIDEHGSLGIVIELAQPDPLLPQLMTDPAAMILPADHASRSDFAARPVGTGPYLVSENDEWHLLMRSFDHYFGFRGLLDEIEVIVWPELPHATGDQETRGNSAEHSMGENGIESGQHTLSVHSSAWLSSSISDIDYASGMAVYFTGKPSDQSQEMFLERGGYFLLCDSRSSHWRTIEQRRWIREKLNPYLLAQQLVEPIRSFWVPTGSLLPSWFHCMDGGPAQAPFAAFSGRFHPHADVLTLAYHCQHPEYRMLATEIQKMLDNEGIRLDIIELDYARWARGEGDADLWLGTVNFAVPEVWNVGSWLLGMPLLKHSISGGDQEVFSMWQQQWRKGELSSKQLVQYVVGEGWLQPLFHHWMRLKGPEHAQGIHLNNLGWFNFKTTWMEPK